MSKFHLKKRIVQAGRVIDAPVLEANEEDMTDFEKLKKKAVALGYPDKGLIKIIPPASYKPTMISEEDALKIEIKNPCYQEVERVEPEVYSVNSGSVPDEWKQRINRTKESDKTAKTKKKIIQKKKAKDDVDDDEEKIILTVGDLKKFGSCPLSLQNKSYAEKETFLWEVLRKNGNTAEMDDKMPVYGSDEAGSLMSYNQDKITLLNLPGILKGTINRTIGPLVGISVPMLYFGSWATMFVAHREDLDTPAFSYLHFGDGKTWYGTKPKDEPKVLRLAQSRLERFLRHEGNVQCRDVLRHKDFILDPQLFLDAGIDLIRCVQEQGQFVLVASRSIHFGYNNGFNLAESVNWADLDFIKFGVHSTTCEVLYPLFGMEHFVYEHEYENFHDYINGRWYTPDPTSEDKEPRLVKPPVLLQTANFLEYGRQQGVGVDLILRYATVGSVQMVYVRISYTSSWAPKKEIESLEWNCNGQQIVIPSEFFNYDPTHQPNVLDGVNSTPFCLYMGTPCPRHAHAISLPPSNQVVAFQDPMDEGALQVSSFYSSKSRQQHGVKKKRVKRARNFRRNYSYKKLPPVPCEVCKRNLLEFRTGSERNRHVRECLDKKNGTQPKCFLCGKTYARKDQVTKHEKLCVRAHKLAKGLGLRKKN